ncbi:MAG: DNA-processing protein DprA, partial [Acidimicrobiia bacterium]
MSALLDLALLGSNPDRIRRLMLAGESAVRSEVASCRDPSTRWPVDGVRFLSADELPAGLTSLPDAPPWLFVRGAIPTGPAVAVVGSRRATRYGLELARRIGRTVGGSGWPVVSGLALGVDAAAHEGCLEVGGTALAVLGSGVDVWYPRSNRRLGERILESGGGIVSEFGPGITPEPWRFPFRNRIISGLASVVIVVEAAVRSGALITAHLAVAQGREVMAVPGDIDRATSVGCNLLIRDGAHPITTLDDLVETIEFWLGPAPARP